MLTWFRLWPLLALPSGLLAVLISLPMFEIRGTVLGGGLVRQWLLNEMVLPLLPIEQAQQLVNWFVNASILQEWCLAMFVGININAVLLLPLYLIGQGFIHLSGWHARTELDLKRKGLR